MRESRPFDTQAQDQFFLATGWTPRHTHGFETCLDSSFQRCCHLPINTQTQPSIRETTITRYYYLMTIKHEKNYLHDYPVSWALYVGFPKNHPEIWKPLSGTIVEQATSIQQKFQGMQAPHPTWERLKSKSIWEKLKSNCEKRESRTPELAIKSQTNHFIRAGGSSELWRFGFDVWTSWSWRPTLSYGASTSSELKL